MGKRFNKLRNCFRRKKKKVAAGKEPSFDYQALPTDIQRCIPDFLPTDSMHLGEKSFNKLKNCFRRKKKKAAAAEKKPGFDYQALPTDMKRCILDFLPTDDIISLTQTSKCMESELGLSRTAQPVIKGPCSQNISVMTFGRMSNPLSPVAAIVPTEPERIQSISFQCDWMDQGMGMRKGKGKLFVVAQKKSSLHDKTTYVPFDQGRVVCGPSSADYIMSNLSVTFYAKPDEFYQIWCFVGNCYGDMLHFKNMRFNILRYGEKTKNQACPILRYRFSYEEDDETHMQRMTLRLIDYIFPKAAMREEQ